jgi:hypothetical protein
MLRDSSALCFGATDLPRDRTGDLVNSGEPTPGEVVEYAAPVVEVIEGIAMPSVEDILWAHHRALFSPSRKSRRRATPAFTTHRSLRRG